MTRSGEAPRPPAVPRLFLRAALVAALAVLAVAAVTLSPAAAQPESPRRGTVRPPELDVVDFTPVLLPGGTFELRLRIRNPSREELDDLRLVVTIERKVISRFDYQQAVDEGRASGVFEAFADDVEPLAPRGSRLITLTQTAAELGFARPANKYGVYPLRVELVDDDEPVDTVRTSLVVAPETVEQPVRLAMLWPLDAPPALQPDGSYRDRRLTAAMTPGGRLRDLVDAALVQDDVALTVAPSGLLLDQAADLADGYVASEGTTRLAFEPSDRPPRRAAEFLERVGDLARRAGTDVLALGYGPGDLPALVRGGLSAEAARQVSAGRVLVEDLAQRRTQQRVLWPAAGMTSAALRDAMAAGIDTVIVGEEFLDPPDGRELRFTPSPLRQLRTAAGPIDVLVPDPWFASTLRAVDDDEGAAVAAQRILGETAAVYFERPYAEEPRGLLLAPPHLWDPPPGLPAALLTRLAQAPWLRPVTLSGLRSAVERSTPGTTLRYPEDAREAELPASYVGALAEGRTVLASLATVLTEGERLAQRFDRFLLTAGSVHYRDRRLRPEGVALLDAVRGAVTELYEGVSVVESVPVTLTSIEGRIPELVRNTAPIPLAVRVRLASPRYRFEDGAVQEVVLGAGEQTRLDFRARALSPGGTYPITVVVEDGEGALVLARGRLVVRSTAYSIVALVATGGAAAFLLLWWAYDARRRRHARVKTEASQPTAAA